MSFYYFFIKKKVNHLIYIHKKKILKKFPILRSGQTTNPLLRFAVSIEIFRLINRLPIEDRENLNL